MWCFIGRANASYKHVKPPKTKNRANHTTAKIKKQITMLNHAQNLQSFANKLSSFLIVNFSFILFIALL